MKERRWDIELRVISGPTASRQVAVLRGPNVVLGVQPGPGGLVLPSGLGIAPQHCTITAYDPQTVHIAAVGHNPVRVAPYADVAWGEIEPIAGRVTLARGNAIHLGPTANRGVTVEFLGLRDLGIQETKRLSSDGKDDAVLTRPPDGIQAARARPGVRTLLTDWLDPSTFRLLMVTLLAGSAFLLAMAGVVGLGAYVEELRGEGSLEFEVVDLRVTETLAEHQGFALPLYEFVIGPSRALAGDVAPPEVDPNTPERWDPRLMNLVVQWARTIGKKGTIWREFERVQADERRYAQVVEQLRAAGLPEVFAGIPYQESRYRQDPISPCCAAGWWQFMPEYGNRLAKVPGFGAEYAVQGCRAPGSQVAWDIVGVVPPRNACHPDNPRATYIRRGPACQLGKCDRDFRFDFERSTRVAIHTLGEAARDPLLAASGAAVAATIASHNAGYNDASLDPRVTKPKNLLPSYRAWFREEGATKPTAHFIGDSVRCRDLRRPDEGCERYLQAETQGYVVGVIAYHLLAVCYYGRHVSDDPAYAAWGRFVGPGSYCDEVGVPARRVSR